MCPSYYFRGIWHAKRFQGVIRNSDPMSRCFKRFYQEPYQVSRLWTVANLGGRFVKCHLSFRRTSSGDKGRRVIPIRLNFDLCPISACDGFNEVWDFCDASAQVRASSPMSWSQNISTDCRCIGKRPFWRARGSRSNGLPWPIGLVMPPGGCCRWRNSSACMSRQRLSSTPTIRRLGCWHLATAKPGPGGFGSIWSMSGLGRDRMPRPPIIGSARTAKASGRAIISPHSMA
jgi:hypothetical protein